MFLLSCMTISIFFLKPMAQAQLAHSQGLACLSNRISCHTCLRALGCAHGFPSTSLRMQYVLFFSRTLA